MNSSVPKRPRSLIGCLILIVLFSAFNALVTFPYGVVAFGSFGVIALVSIFLRVGWCVPFTIAGFYFGMFVLNPSLKHGPIDAQMYETVGLVATGTVVGFGIGITLDMCSVPADDPSPPEHSQETGKDN